MALPWHRVQRILVTVMILSFLVAILGGVGEVLGGWDAIGEVMMTAGTSVGALAGILTLLGGATQDQVRTIRSTVADNNTLLRRGNRKLETLDGIQFELDRQTGVLADQMQVLRQIRDQL